MSDIDDEDQSFWHIYETVMNSIGDPNTDDMPWYVSLGLKPVVAAMIATGTYLARRLFG